jgi:lipopolysaccharide transport system permease protein
MPPAHPERIQAEEIGTRILAAVHARRLRTAAARQDAPAGKNNIMDVSKPMPGPLRVIRPARGWQAINLPEIWRFRDLLVTLAGRDIKLRYRQTAVGAAWVVLQPLMAAGIFSVVFGRVAKLPSDGVPYFIFSYAGLMAWTAFSSTLTKASTSMVQSASLVSKVAFPRLILPLSVIFGVLLDFAVAAGMMAVLMVIYHVPPSAGILLLPVWLAMVLMLAMGFGLICTSLMVSYRDVQYVLPVLVQFLMYASPVAYGLSAVPKNLHLFFVVNPLSGPLEAFRWSVFGLHGLQTGMLIYSAALSITVFVVGVYVFKRMERRFADVI